MACLLIFVINRFSLAAEKITISGTGDSQALLRILAAKFEKEHPGAVIEIPDSIGSSGGIKAVAEGRSVLGRVARPIKDKEKAYNLNYKVFAYSPVVFTVNPGVRGVDSLSFEQIVDIFSGKLTSWSELGGSKKKIYVAQREEGDSSRSAIEENIPGWKGIKLYSGEIIYNTPELISVIAKYDGTIGYAPLSMAGSAELILLKINGVYPSLENIKDGSYKLKTPFALIWKGELKGLAKEFFDFILSPQGQKIIAENGAVPISWSK